MPARSSQPQGARTLSQPRTGPRIGVPATLGMTMWERTPTTRRRPSGARRRAPASVLAAVLVAVAGAGCSGSTDSSSSAATKVPSPTASTTPIIPSATMPTPRFTPKPPEDKVTMATPRQVIGLVRIVASIGTDGHTETSTGMILSGDGQVVTNNHGVAGAGTVQVTVMSTGRTYGATIAATDVGHDIALLHMIGAVGLAQVTFAPRDASVGDRVAVVGDAGGLVSTFTAATGSVVAVDQTVVTPPSANHTGEQVTGLTLFTCNVAIGESGGPTYDARRRVVGMTTARIPGPTRIDGVAIPIGTLRVVLRDLASRAAG